MKFFSIDRRLTALEPVAVGSCPCCQALEAMSEEELDVRIEAFASGQECSELPTPSPTCPRCQRVAAMTEEELDAELARLHNILQDVAK